MARGPLVVDGLDQQVGAEARAVAAGGHVAAGAIDAVDSYLDHLAIGGGHAALLRQDATDELGMDILGIDVDGRAAFERPVAGDVYAPILHRRATAAGAADAHAAVVADLGIDAVDAHQGDVDLRVGIGVIGADRVERDAVRLGHDEADDRLACGVRRIIDL